MIGYSEINRMKRGIVSGLGFFEVLTSVANLAAQGYTAYLDYEKLGQQEDALKLQKNQLAAQLAAVQDAKAAAAEAQRQAAEAQQQQAARQQAMGLPVQTTEVPMWVWVVGAVTVTGLAAFIVTRKRRR